MTCSACGSELLLFDICSLCDADSLYCSSELLPESSKVYMWQIQLGVNWVRYDLETEELIRDAVTAGASTVEYCARRQSYIIDLNSMEQRNRVTGVRRAIRRVENEVAEPEEPGFEPVQDPCPQRPDRLKQLVEHLLSPAVQVQLPLPASEVSLQLSPAIVAQVFKQHVPGVEHFLYRDLPDKHSLEFIVTAYTHGLNAFAGTPLHDHLLWLLRLIVHYAHDCKPGSSRYLRDVAEAFRDCQAVQARVIERVGLEIRGISADFKGHVTRLIGNYKTMAIKVLAFERIAQRRASDDGNPTHYENRLTADLGDLLGLNQDEIRQARLDEHRKRFNALSPDERLSAFARCREVFDIEALLKALVGELNSFSVDSPSDSISHQFLKWASSSITQKHVVFDLSTCMVVDVEESLVPAILEVLFLGQSLAPADAMYRGFYINKLFGFASDTEMEDGKAQKKPEDTLCLLDVDAKVEHAETEKKEDALSLVGCYSESANAWEKEEGALWGIGSEEASRIKILTNSLSQALVVQKFNHSSEPRRKKNRNGKKGSK